MTCGYICPQCGGSGYTDEGEVCDWCKPVAEVKGDDKNANELSDEGWMKETHEGKCCADD